MCEITSRVEAFGVFTYEVLRVFVCRSTVVVHLCFDVIEYEVSV